SRNLGGTGLGLAIVKHVAHAHRGDILVTSQPGEGSCFTLLLPRAQVRETV
nr:ATP-binding protein [Thiomicrorhabdus sp.]